MMESEFYPHDLDCYLKTCDCGYSGGLNTIYTHWYTYGKYYRNAKTHWGTCVFCGEQGEPEQHEAWCFAPTKCLYCGAAVTASNRTLRHAFYETANGTRCRYCSWTPPVTAHEHNWVCGEYEFGYLGYGCSICGRVAQEGDDISTAKPHGTMLYYNQLYHFRQCHLQSHRFQAPHTFSGGTCTVCGYTRSTTDALFLPAGLLRVDASAMAGIAAREVFLPQSCTAIGSGAFSGSQLAYVHIPNGSTSIADDAFNGCNLKGIYCPANSSVWQWAKAKGYPVIRE
ncbi:MAG: leucine-rich repeat protein [Clostridia bacterium]|nr:leucine-rich repeat protein [Clostridia bacterium]